MNMNSPEESERCIRSYREAYIALIKLHMRLLKKLQARLEKAKS